MNFIEIIGNVVSDPEQRVTPSGTKMTVLVIADNQKKGEKDEVLWWRVVIWDGDLQRIVPYIKKGSRVVVYGTMRKPRTYVDSSGNHQASLELKAFLVRFIPGSRTDSGSESSSFVKGQKEGKEAFDDLSGDVEYTTLNTTRPSGFAPGEGYFGGGENYSEDSSPF